MPNLADEYKEPIDGLDQFSRLIQRFKQLLNEMILQKLCINRIGAIAIAMDPNAGEILAVS
ncbi:hypothetical protein KHA80_19215 [Anaerobacillus sp. HL2]|nr:hypothetical protein KHA80_19215 [Anaerobacillus sp. HL2]